MRSRRVAAGVLGLLLGGAALVWMGRTLDVLALRRSASAVPAWQWVLASGGVLLSYALRAARLHAEWRGVSGAVLPCTGIAAPTGSCSELTVASDLTMRPSRYA